MCYKKIITSTVMALLISVTNSGNLIGAWRRDGWWNGRRDGRRRQLSWWYGKRIQRRDGK